MAQEVVLQTRELKKYFGGVKAVDGVELAIPRGELRAIIGPNGAGKTTLFNLITGHLPHDSGAIYLKDKEISNLPPHQVFRRGISRTFQLTSIFRGLTALENVQVALMAHHRRHFNIFAPAKKIYQEQSLSLLERVGLSEEALKPGGILSHGDQKRLELAIALASGPDLLMLDEPTAGMAPRERQEIMRLVERIGRAENLTILFTEHDMDVVFSVAERITVMHQGGVIAEGNPGEVRADREVQRVYLGEHL
ncbi:MAG: ABC transporter ATP-binding protein [Candidatus Tectomicrobia bacterium]|nr:ABC transporter ATP-binding protein [Candidatus Tectomicrobia bacterium]